ncbi:YciI family protein [Pseudonocardia benzenivorans]|jgi:uncharacterized protein YciI|uniref:YCII-related protein n=2 Tax=Pseudonocardia TaxID=1847 RepID=F4CNS9_PSEUX|nr:YciI family protein [Pseudonocardia dioxanivorans]AEA22541.1 YCII-related protein [Pseudonocardia dioxanivorans CB1190]GJF01343.1 hypothetical protein PSD17_03070 [Pseudonocardia sp. D17]
MFVCLLTYHREIDRDGPLFAAHKSFVQENVDAHRFLFSGPRIGAPGGVIVAHGQDEAAARTIFDGDPFVVDGTATYELVQFTAGLADPALNLEVPA